MDSGREHLFSALRGVYGEEAPRFFQERIDCLACLIARGCLPEEGAAESVDPVRFLQAAGMMPGARTCRDAAAFARAVNDRLFAVERGYPGLFGVAEAGAWSARPAEFGNRLGRRRRRAVRRLLSVAALPPAASFEERLARLWSRIVRLQEPERLQLLMLLWLLRGLCAWGGGEVLTAMQLKLLAKGLDVGSLRGGLGERGPLEARLPLQSEGASLEAPAGELIVALEGFLRDVPGSERGEMPRGAGYRGRARLLSAAIRHPVIVRTLAWLCMQTAGRLLLEGRAGVETRRMLPRIVDAALSRTQTAYLRILIRNRAPIDFKPQAAADVTEMSAGNAWQRTFPLAGGGSASYAQALRALTLHFERLSVIRQRRACSWILRVFGVRVHVEDPLGTLGHLPASPLCILANHESYLDIAVLFDLLRERRLAFVARDDLLYTTGAIGAKLAGGPHVAISRAVSGMSTGEGLRLYRRTIAEFRRALRTSCADLAVFPQGTRSRDGGFPAEEYRERGAAVLKLAKEEGAGVLPLHLKFTGRAFMFAKAPLARIAGVRDRWPVRGLAARRLTLLDTRETGRIAVAVGPLMAVEDPEAVMDRLVAFHRQAGAAPQA